jgi:hypothetical protein
VDEPKISGAEISLPWLGEHGLVNKLANRSRDYSFGYKTSAPRSTDFKKAKKNR